MKRSRFADCAVRMAFRVRPFTNGAANSVDEHPRCQAVAPVGEENARLKRLVGEQALDIVVLKDVISKNI